MNHSEKRVLTNELTGLKTMLCDPAGEVVITGSLADRQKIAAHLGALTDLSNDPAEDEGEEAASAPQVAPPFWTTPSARRLRCWRTCPRTTRTTASGPTT